MLSWTIGDVTITSIIERDGPWRKPEDMFPAYDAAVGRRHLEEMDPVVFDPVSRQWHRWEVWQVKDAGGQSHGHVHCDLMHPDSGVGGGAYRIGAAWDGSAAGARCAVLTHAQDYPYRDRYRAWPGPNSNTFVAWVLREAGLHHSLDPRAIGKDYCGPDDKCRAHCAVPAQ